VSKALLSQAAELRRMSISQYVRHVAVAQAKREVRGAREEIIVLTPQEQMTFWKALSRTPRLTRAQRRLGRLMRAE
jgi:uncharacterized protein (DUF1778 family)